MRYLVLVLPLVLMACSRPAQPPPAPAPAAAPVATADPWPGKYEGDLRVEVSGPPGRHKVSLLTAGGDCIGDIGLSDGGVAARDVSAYELMVILQPDPATTCKVGLTRDGNTVTVTEDNCGHYHGATCGFAGTATRVK